MDEGQGVLLGHWKTKRKKRDKYGFATRPNIPRGKYCLAGEPPTGLARAESIPTVADIQARIRAPGKWYDGLLCGSTTSIVDGSWRIDDLNPKFSYDVVARKDGYNDVVVSNVTPVNYLRLYTKSLTFTNDKAQSSPIEIRGAEGALTVSVSGLPSGLSYSNGVISGTVSAETGHTQCVVTMTDDSGTRSEKIDIEVKSKPLILAVDFTAPFIIDAPYTTQAKAFGGRKPYQFLITDGDLPDGLTLDSVTGVVSGSVSDEYSENDPIQFTITVRDSNNESSSRLISSEVV